MPLNSLKLLRSILLALAGGAALSAAMAAPPTAAQYAAPPALYNVVLSPSGKRAAMIITDKTDGRRILATLDLPPRAAPKVVASYGDADVNEAYWVTEDRLVLEARQPGTFELLRDGGGGVFAVNHDGSDYRELIAYTRASGAPSGSNIRSRTLSNEWDMVALRRGTAEIFVRQYRADTSGESAGSKLARLDTLSGLLTPISVGAPAFAQQWAFVGGEPQAARVVRKGRDQTYLRKPGTEQWEVISDVAESDPRAIEPISFESDSELLVRTNAGGNTEGLYIFDLKKKALDPEPLLSTPRYDLGSVRFDRFGRRAIAGQVTGDRPQTVWFDPKLGALQKSLDASLPPDRTNDIICTECETSAFYVVRSRSDRHPGEFLLYDPEKRSLLSLGVAYPDIDPETQGRRTFQWIKARDGLPLPVIVTHPPGSDPKKPLPAVVLVHGGPWVNAPSTLWNPEAQFLATRGWRVIEPQFRGTLGFGAQHVGASFKQWGQRMQDDVTDSVAWAVQQGLVDDKRVCIYGGSYGGYSALMGPVRDPGLYRCAISLVGVTDIMLMFENYVSDTSSDLKRYSLPQRIGDPKADREMLNTYSPLRRVADIKVPVLLGVGLLDRRVPREHADAFESAARKAGVNIERVNYGDEGHGFTLPVNQADFWTRMEAFLNRYIKP
jgi:dipeptidyl aminopeptidase/acylaminoacyl peptidase